MPVINCPGGEEFEPHPEGRAEGEVYEVEDRPEMETQWGLKHKVCVKIESTTAVRSDGSPALIFLWWNVSGHPRSTMYKQRTLIKGSKLTDEEAENFDTQSLVGKKLGYQVLHNAASDGRIFANVVSLWPIEALPAPAAQGSDNTGTLLELIGKAVAEGEYDQAKATQITALVDEGKLSQEQVAEYIAKFEAYLTERGLMPKAAPDPNADLPF